MDKYLLGIDNGSTVSKAAIFTTTGREIAAAARKVNLVEPRPGLSERDMNETWNSTAEAIRQVLAESGIDPGRIAGIACTGHGNGIYLVDVHGKPVRNAINSTDSRAQSYVDKWLADGVSEKVLPKTAQSIWPAQPNALLSWLRDNEPDTIEKARWVLMCKDFIRYRLCGQINAELTDMSGTSLMNVVTAEYDDQVLELFGISEMKGLLPPIIKTADIAGTVTAEAAAQTNLKQGTPVAGGMFDIDACGLASGIIDERQMSLVAGTWGNNQYIAAEPLIDRELFMTSCYSIGGWYLMLEGSPTSASNLEWFVTEFLGSQRAAAQKAGKSVYELCNRMVESVSAKEAAITFLPFLYGSNAGAGAKSCIIGLEGFHTRAHVLRAIYEGIVFAHNTHLQRLLKFRDPPEVIRFTGGAARSEVWVQMFADCFQIPVEIPAGTELGALGAAIAAAVAVGLYSSYEEAVGAMTRIESRREPNRAQKEIYTEKYERYKKVILALEPVWENSI
ncbi:MAG TPA: carbohydrate kinase [Planctomycetes bacterium]|nr:carbohydrate kinase [Planctomycetota bacterium]